MKEEIQIMLTGPQSKTLRETGEVVYPRKLGGFPFGFRIGLDENRKAYVKSVEIDLTAYDWDIAYYKK